MTKRKKKAGLLAPDGDTLKEALDKLTPEQTEMFMEALSRTLRKRRLMLAGNLLALFFLIGGLVWSLYAFGTSSPGTFRAWVFLVPFALAGTTLVVFGRLAKRAGGLRLDDIPTVQPRGANGDK